jgi:dienelactone hydrolase
MKKFIFGFFLSFNLYAACDGSSRVFTHPDAVDGSLWAMTSKQYLTSNPTSPMVFILPPIVGETILDRRLAERFCRAGLSTLILHAVREVSPEREARDLAIHDESYVRAHGAVSAVMNAIEAQGLRPTRYGVLGMSLGGMLAAYVAGAENKISASVVVAGAGNAAGVLSHSDQELVVAQRKKRFETLGFTGVDSYEAALRAAISHDPLSVAANVPARSMYLFIATRDTTVPTRYQRELRQAINSPLVFEMRAGHTSGLVKAGTIHAGKITNFMVKRLKD